MILLFLVSGVSNSKATNEQTFELAGSWLGPCVFFVSHDGTAVWSASTYTFNKGNFTFISKHYADKSCSKQYSHPALESPSILKGTYNFLSEINTTSGHEAKLFEITYDLSRFGRGKKDVVEAGIFIQGNTLYFVAALPNSFEVHFDEPWKKTENE